MTVFYVIELFRGPKRLFTTGSRTVAGIAKEIRRVRPRVADATRATVYSWRRDDGEFDHAGYVRRYPQWRRVEKYSEELR